MAPEINFKVIFFILILLAVGLEVIADILFKKWSLGNKNSVLILGLIIYFIGTLFWAISLKYEYLSKAITIFTVLNLVIIVLAGVIVFKPNFDSWKFDYRR